MTFGVLGINEKIVKALREQGIVNPTMIQSKAIPLIKKGFDVIGMSKTGSGKTAAFAAPILERIVPHKGIQVLILSPTRELAIQISKEISKFGKYVDCGLATVYGGVGYGPQLRDLSEAEIVVGTTGRLCDHLKSGNLNLSRLNCIVLDEADKMVEMGFIDDIRLILKHTPKEKQVLLFGATISDEVNQLKREHMRSPHIAEAEAQVEGEYLQQFYYNVEHFQKFSFLVHLLKNETITQAIIFCSARSTCEMVSKNLYLQGIKNELIHGKLTQNKRQQVMDRFNAGRTKILVASSVASRGLDIKGISHIFNYDLSKDPQDYIHRIGRTARAGEKGKAITLLSSRDHDAFRHIHSRYPVEVEALKTGEFQNLRFQKGFQSEDSRRDNFRNREPRRRGYR